MNGKIILATALMLIVMASSAFATLTVTITSPASGTVYNNLPANIHGVPITFTIVDDNAVTVRSDMNITLRYGPLSTLIANNAGTELINDKNLFDYNADGSLYSSTFGCDIKTDGPSLATCTYNLQLPPDTTWTNGNTYWIDINAVDFARGGNGDGVDEDQNATTWISINNKMSTIGSVTALLVPISAILVAALLIIGIFSIAVLGADPMKTSVMIVVGAITIAVVAMVLGYFIGVM